MGDFKSTEERCPELPPIEFVCVESRRRVLCEEFGGVLQKAVVGRVVLKSQLQFQADDGDSGVNAFEVNKVPDQAYFLRAEGG